MRKDIFSAELRADLLEESNRPKAEKIKPSLHKKEDFVYY